MTAKARSRQQEGIALADHISSACRKQREEDGKGERRDKKEGSGVRPQVLKVHPKGCSSSSNPTLHKV